MLTIFKILRGRERCTGDDGKLDLLKRLALDTGALRETLLGLLENLTLIDSQSSRSQKIKKLTGVALTGFTTNLKGTPWVRLGSRSKL